MNSSNRYFVYESQRQLERLHAYRANDVTTNDKRNRTHYASSDLLAQVPLAQYVHHVDTKFPVILIRIIFGPLWRYQVS